MLDRVALIIDKRKELSTRYKKLIESIDIKVFVCDSIKDSLDILTKYEPDIVIISDSIDDDQAENCKRLRVLSYSFRPVLLALSKSAHMPDMINTLNAGADDFLSEPIEAEEFLARVNAHLRRHLESSVNLTTKLFDSKISFQYLRRILLNPSIKFYALLFDINNFDFYRAVYGDIAADKMLQTYQAIITSAIDKDDYLGHLGKEDFILVTQNPNVEKIASFCIYAFDKVAEKFYSKTEKDSGFMLMKGNDSGEKPVALVSTSIGIVSNEYRTFSGVKELVSTLIGVHKLAKYEEHSTYVFDRQKLTSSEEIKILQKNLNILIIEPDEALSYLISTTSGIYGFNALCYDFSEEVFDLTEKYDPAVILVDINEDNNIFNSSFCKKLKTSENFSKIKIIATSATHNKLEILNSGADVYLPKPYDVLTLFTWIKEMAEKFNETT